MSAEVSHQPILFPCLLGLGRAILPESKAGMTKHWVKRYAGGNRYLFRDGMNEHFRPRFLIDRTGAYRPIQVIGLHRRRLGFMAWLVDFTLSECEVGLPERLECSQLRKKLSAVKWDWHFQDAVRLQRFLKQKPPAHVFGEADFREFWKRCCQPLPETEWRQQYPDE